MIGCATVEPTTTNFIHECFGYNLNDRIDEYIKPDLTRTEPTFVAADLAQLQSIINSTFDHQGAVYELAAGTYTGTLSIVNRVNFTIYTDPANPATIDAAGQNFGIQFYNTQPGISANAEILNFRITNANFHGIFLGGDGAAQHAPRDTYIAGNEIYNVALQTGGGIVLRHGLEGDLITIECNLIRDLVNSQSNFAMEGVYVGQGSDHTRYTSNVRIVGNTFRNLRGEAIDIKRNSADITIEYNNIDGIEVHSQGAIVLGLDPIQAGDTYDANFIVRRNCITNVTSRNADGNFIVVGNAYTLIEDNIMFNAVNVGIDVYNDCDGPNTTVIIQNNIIWNYQNLPIRENFGSGNAGPVNPCDVSRATNIVQSDAIGSECLETADIFQGPLTTCDGFRPAGQV